MAPRNIGIDFLVGKTPPRLRGANFFTHFGGLILKVISMCEQSVSRVFHRLVEYRKSLSLSRRRLGGSPPLDHNGAGHPGRSKARIFPLDHDGAMAAFSLYIPNPIQIGIYN